MIKIVKNEGVFIGPQGRQAINSAAMF